jgi:hypothetical protein
MSRPPGIPKTGGRQKGTPNRSTTKLRECFDNAGFDVPEKIIELLPKLEAADQAKVLMDLMAYLYPKRKATEADDGLFFSIGS